MATRWAVSVWWSVDQIITSTEIYVTWIYHLLELKLCSWNVVSLFKHFLPQWISKRENHSLKMWTSFAVKKSCTLSSCVTQHPRLWYRDLTMAGSLHNYWYDMSWPSQERPLSTWLFLFILRPLTLNANGKIPTGINK